MLKERLVLTATNINRNLCDESTSFFIKTVKIDNYSGLWLKVNPDGVFVPPFTIGVIIDFFVQAAHVKIDTISPTAIAQQASASAGEVIVSLYDTPQYPFPGYSINPPWAQAGIQVGAGLNRGFDGVSIPTAQGDMPLSHQIVGIEFAAPMHYSGDEGNESYFHIQSRQCVYVADAVQAVAAGINTNIAGIVPIATVQRLLWFEISTDTSGELSFGYSVFGFKLARQYVQAGIPVVVPIPGNGIFLNGSAASRFQALHSNGGNVYAVVGMGRN